MLHIGQRVALGLDVHPRRQLLRFEVGVRARRRLALVSNLSRQILTNRHLVTVNWFRRLIFFIYHPVLITLLILRLRRIRTLNLLFNRMSHLILHHWLLRLLRRIKLYCFNLGSLSNSRNQCWLDPTVLWLRRFDLHLFYFELTRIRLLRRLRHPSYHINTLWILHYA